MDNLKNIMSVAIAVADLDETLSLPREEGRPGRRAHVLSISPYPGPALWIQPMHRARLSTCRPGPTAGRLPGICSPPASVWLSERNAAIWTAPAHESQPVRTVI